MNPKNGKSSPLAHEALTEKESNWMRFFWWLRRLVYLWVKSKSLPKEAKDVEWDSEKPVCYVLNSDSVTDRLILDYHCEKLKLPRPRLSIKELNRASDGSYLYLSKSGLLQKQKTKPVPIGIYKLLQKVEEEQKDIQVIPVSVFWGRNAGKEEKSLIKLLFFDDENGGLFQRFILFFVQGRNVYCSFGRPISILNFVNQEKEKIAASKKLRRVLRVHFHRLRESMVGPYLYDRRQMVHSILHSKGLKLYFEQELEKKGKTREKLEEQAVRYIDEIAADISPHVIRFADTILNWIFNKLYKGIDVRNGEVLRNLAETHEIVYLPCHRSHMDYLLLSFSLYRLGVTTPHTAAGINLNFWPIGSLFRRGGAFFIRRSFGGNKLYSTVFTEYVNFLLQGGYSMCFYVEGGRSRTGRLLQPKLGMLSMVLKSFESNSEKPIMLVPTFIAYDKLMEARSYFHELKGKSKKAESVWQLFRMPRLLAYEFGRAYINFGEPIDLKSYLSKSSEQSNSETLIHLSNDVMRNINKSIQISPVSLFSIAILSLPKKAIAEDDLINMVNSWLSLLRAIPYDSRVLIPDLDAKELLKTAESLSQVNRFEHITGDVIYVNDSDCVFLNYYRNNILPLFIIPSLIAHIFLHCRLLSFTDLIRTVSETYKLLRNDFFLKWTHNEIESVIRTHVHAMMDLGLLKLENDILSGPLTHTPQAFSLTHLGRIIGHVIERYCLYISLLPRNSASHVDIETFGKDCESLAKKSSILNGYHEYDYFDKNEYKQFIDTMIDLQYLKRNGNSFDVLENAKQCISNLSPLNDAISKKMMDFGKENERPEILTK